jgi:iron complex outermembrane receptor protein
MKRALLATALSTHALMGAAFAQEDEADRRLETVLITSAPGPDRASDELVGNATALDRADIVADLASTLGDSLSGEPGIASTSFGQGASRPVLRGLGAERVQVLTNGIGVIDVSAASPDHQVAADGIDAEKIEILRGPAALAYGGQAIGGVVNVIDGLISESLPEKAFEGDALAAYGSVNNGTELAGRLRGARGPFVLALSAATRDFGDYDVPGYVKSSRQRALEASSGSDPADDERGSVSNSFLDTQSLGAGVSYVGAFGFAGLAVRNQQATYGLLPEDDAQPFIDLDQTRYDARAGVDLGGDVLKRLSGSVAYADYSHTEFEGPGEPGTIFDTHGIEARGELDHAFAGFEGALGVQLMQKELSTVGDEAFIAPTDSDARALFLYEARDWDNGFGLEGGLRAERVKHDNRDFGEAEFDLFSGSAGAHIHSDTGWFAGVQASYTERAPNESELFAFGPHLATRQFEVGDASLDKERGLNLEGSLRWKLDRYSIGVNIFRTGFSDFIYLTPGTADAGSGPESEIDGLPVFVFSQADAVFKGAEIYGDAWFDDAAFGADWHLKGGIDFVDAKLDTGTAVPFVPPLRVSAEATASWRLFELGAGAEWAADQSDVGIGQLPTDSYTLVSLRAALNLAELGYGGDGTQVFVDVRNATDAEARAATSVLKDYLPLPGRNVRAGLRVTF